MFTVESLFQFANSTQTIEFDFDRKGQIVAVRSPFLDLPESAQKLIAGDGPEAETLRRAMREWHSRIEFLMPIFADHRLWTIRNWPTVFKPFRSVALLRTSEKWVGEQPIFDLFDLINALAAPFPSGDFAAPDVWHGKIKPCDRLLEREIDDRLLAGLSHALQHFDNEAFFETVRPQKPVFGPLTCAAFEKKLSDADQKNRLCAATALIFGARNAYGSPEAFEHYLAQKMRESKAKS